MSIFRLFSFSLLLAFGITPAIAQSNPLQETNSVQPQEPAAQNSSSFELISPKFKADLDAQEPLDRFRIEDYRRWPDQFRLHPRLDLGPDGVENDVFCFATRTYKVARYNAQSDSTHLVGYTTCEPSNRVRVHTTEGRAVVTTP